jgi:bacteriorhodopsin
MTDTRADYDSPWKGAIELYFWEFMAFFFLAIAPHLGQHRDPEFLDTELQQIVRDIELYRCIDWLIDLPEPLEIVFQAELAAYEGDGTMRYVSTIER